MLLFGIGLKKTVLLLIIFFFNIELLVNINQDTLNILLSSTALFAMIYSINYLQVFVTSALDQETFKKQVGI